MLTRSRHFILQQNVVILLLLLVVYFAFTTGSLFLNGQNIHNIARQISFDIPLALALTVVLIAGGIDLSVGSVLSMAAALTMGLQPFGTWLAVLVALLFGAGTGLVNGLLVTKGKIVPFIAPLGTMTVVRGAMLPYPRQQPIPGTDASFTFWGAGSLGPVPVPILVVLVICVAVHMLLTYTQ